MYLVYFISVISTYAIRRLDLGEYSLFLIPLTGEPHTHNFSVKILFSYSLFPIPSIPKAEINWRTATSYDATKTIIKAVDEMMGNYSRKQLQRILSNPNFSLEGVTGKIRFRESGDWQFFEKDKPLLVQVKSNAKSGKYEFVILGQ
ncbi:MAG: hypothetical protein F6K15_06620 [Okeania sp. SIO2B3]|nr:hypothetical protein [Okeania sp. SIO2B3]